MIITTLVEKVYDNNHVYTSESGYGSSAFWNQHRYNNNGRWGCNSNYSFKGFIYNPAVKDEPAPKPSKSVDELAQEVIAGLWGNQPERQQRLEAAGYDYYAVQAKVNEILAPAPAPKPSKSVDDLAREVIRGDWGNGQERKDRLTAAGYDYSTVQARVNEMLSGNKPAPKPVDNTVTYTVKPGDTLWGIAERFLGKGSRWREIYYANQAIIGANPNIIYPGQKLTIKK